MFYVGHSEESKLVLEFQTRVYRHLRCGIQIRHSKIHFSRYKLDTWVKDISYNIRVRDSGESHRMSRFVYVVIFFYTWSKMHQLSITINKFFSLEGFCESRSQGVHFTHLSTLLVWERVFGDFKNTDDDRPFWNVKNVLSSGERLRKQILRDPIEYSFHFIGVLGKVHWGFKNTGFDSPFCNIENVLCPKGTLPKQNPYGVYLKVLSILLWFS